MSWPSDPANLSNLSCLSVLVWEMVQLKIPSIHKKR